MEVSHGQRLLFAPGPKVTVEKFRLVAPGSQEVLVHIRRSQVSAGSELNFLRHGSSAYASNLPKDTPLAIGYMAVGEVIAIGSEIKEIAVGQRVVTAGPHGSHFLVDCSRPNAVLDPIPDGVSDDAAGYVVLADIALHGIRRAMLQIDESVVIFGMGVVGQLTLQLARLSGAYPIIAVDLSDFRLALARENGATHTINAKTADPVTEIKRLTANKGIEVLFHCAPVANILQTVLECAAERGRILLTGSAPGDATIRLQSELLRRELSLIAVYDRGLGQPHPYWRWTGVRNRRACLRLVRDGALNIDRLVTHTILPSEAESTYAKMLKGSDDRLGVAIKWD